MKTKRTFNAPGSPHLLTFSCHERRPLLMTDRTRSWFLGALNNAREKHDFALWAYVIMPEHVHLLVRPRRDDYRMDAILRSIKQPVAMRAMRHLRRDQPQELHRLRVTRPGGRVEHRFWLQGGGYDRNVRPNRPLSESIDYIHMNPVRRGLVSEPVQWWWSSASWYFRDQTGPIEIDEIC